MQSQGSHLMPVNFSSYFLYHSLPIHHHQLSRNSCSQIHGQILYHLTFYSLISEAVGLRTNWLAYFRKLLLAKGMLLAMKFHCFCAIFLCNYHFGKVLIFKD